MVKQRNRKETAKGRPAYKRLPTIQHRAESEQLLTQLKATAEASYTRLAKAGTEFGEANNVICGSEGAKLRALLLDKNVSDVVTVKQLWEERALNDPNCNSLQFVTNGNAEHILPKISSLTLEDDQSCIHGMMKDFMKVLEVFPMELQAAFDKGSHAKESFVLAMNGVNRLSLVYETQIRCRRMATEQQLQSMISYCICQCQSRHTRYSIKKVTVSMALKAREIFVEGKHTHFHLNEITNGFGNLLPQLCKDAMESLKWNWSDMPGDQNWNPKVRVYPICDKHDTTMQSFEVSVVTDFAPPSFVDHIKDEMNKLAFQVGAGGKSKAWLRSASDTVNPAPFTTGGNIVYAGVKASDIEQKLLAIANTFCSGQEEYVKDASKGKNEDYFNTGQSGPYRCGDFQQVSFSKTLRL